MIFVHGKKFLEVAKKAASIEQKTITNEGGGVTSWLLPNQAAKNLESLSISEQIESNRERLNKMEPIGEASAPQNLRTKYGAAEWAISQLKPTGYRVDRQGFGTIYFEEADIRKGAEYADTSVEKAAFVLIPKVLKRGIEIGRHDNHKMRGKSTITFAGPVILNGIRGNMAVVVNLNGNRYNVHRIMLPDGSVFKFSDKNKEVKRESYRGVAKESSLADTTSLTSKNSIPNPPESVKNNFEENESVVAEINESTEKVGIQYDTETAEE